MPNKTNHTDLHSLDDLALLRLPDVLRLIPVSRSKWWAGVAEGIYPKPIKISPRVTCWRCSDVRALLNSFEPDS